MTAEVTVIRTLDCFHFALSLVASEQGKTAKATNTCRGMARHGNDDDDEDDDDCDFVTSRDRTENLCLTSFYLWWFRYCVVFFVRFLAAI